MTDYAANKVDYLRSIAKDKGIKGYSTMKKADLVAALEQLDKPAEVKVSFIDYIKSTFAEAREARSNKGREAAKFADVSTAKESSAKIHNYLEQRSNVTICNKLTAKQARRVRKAQKLEGISPLSYV
jgi:hypothetical protein